MNAPALLEPLPYHREVRDYLKAKEPELWAWFTSARSKESHAEDLRLSLLKSSYRLNADSHRELYQAAAKASVALGIEVGVTLYQSHSPSQVPNASIHHLTGEAHIVLSGPISTLLSIEELTSVFGHELAHHHFWRAENEEFLIADRILDAVALDGRAAPSHVETARRYRLNTEIFADRGAAHVSQNLTTVVSALVKTMTGLPNVSAESYLAQASEIMAQGNTRSRESSHPELFLRAHALNLWTKRGAAADVDISALISGDPQLDTLDLAQQFQLARLSRRLIGELLRPKWMQTEANLAQARLYFPDFSAPVAVDEALLGDLKQRSMCLHEYFVFVLLDFARADREFDDAPLALTLRWAEELGLSAVFEKLVVKELKVSARELGKLKPRISDLLALAEKGL